MRLYAAVSGSADLQVNILKMGDDGNIYVVELKVKGTEKPGRVVQNRIVCQKVQHPWGEGGKSLETPPQVVK